MQVVGHTSSKPKSCPGRASRDDSVDGRLPNWALPELRFPNLPSLCANGAGCVRLMVVWASRSGQSAGAGAQFRRPRVPNLKGSGPWLRVRSALDGAGDEARPSEVGHASSKPKSCPGRASRDDSEAVAFLLGLGVRRLRLCRAAAHGWAWEGPGASWWPGSGGVGVAG